MAVTQMDRQPLNQQVAARIRAELALQGMTQKDLAERMQVPELWISRRLSARSKRAVSLNLDELDHIAAALGITVLALLDPAWRLDDRIVTSRYPLTTRPHLSLVA